MRPGGPLDDRLARASRLLLSLAFVSIGVMHFLRPEPFVAIIPQTFPCKLMLVYVSGVVEVAGGVLILFRRSRGPAGLMLILLLIAVFPANLNMAVNSKQFDSIPVVVLWLRLPLQFLIGWWVYCCAELGRKGSLSKKT